MIFHKELEEWYLKNKRELPWRNTNDPYKIWLSEVILHQTRISYGLNYYQKFIRSYPVIEKLADDSIENILKLWQGLGYYQRARNMHHTAKAIVKLYNGRFPGSYEELKKLKGIGEYTAAAIASFSFKHPVPVIDGNVYRVISRLFGIHEPFDSARGKSIIKKLAYEIFDTGKPDLYNQAIMEFGALQCTPRNPQCDRCVFKKRCIAYNTDQVDALPVKKNVRKTKNRYFYYLILQYKDYVFLKKRSGKDIWQELFDFPLIESSQSLSEKEIFSSSFFQSLIHDNKKPVSVSRKYKHQLSHQTIHAVFYRFRLQSCNSDKFKHLKKIKIPEIHKLPVPRLIEKYIKEEFTSKHI